MQSLYVLTVVVQGLDARSTFRAIDVGAREVNPILEPLAHNRPAFIAFKGAVAFAIIDGGHSLSKRHKALAIVIVSAVNAAYLAVVIHNDRVIDRSVAARFIGPY